MQRLIRRVSILLALTILPLSASAHEVYVLSKDQISHDLTLPPLNLFAEMIQHGHEFIICLMIGVIALLCVFGISISRRVERALDPILWKIKPYSGHIAQITIGCAFLASAHFGALFGTELPLSMLFGHYAQLVTILLYASGVLTLFGILPRIGGLIGAVIYLSAFVHQGPYMVSYLTYLGESLILFFFSGSYRVLSYAPSFFRTGRLMAWLGDRTHFIMRIAFGVSLVYAALYAKLIHGALALDTVTTFHLTNYFHFDPLFIVLGAFLIEMTIALFFILGFEVRFTSIFFLTFLSMSLVFFGESVWPHIILIGTALSLFVHGYDRFGIEGKLYKKGKLEPVL